MRITPKENASKRTKNRLRENTNLEIRKTAEVEGLGKSLLLRDTTTAWLGWLPLNEIEVCDG